MGNCSQKDCSLARPQGLEGLACGALTNDLSLHDIQLSCKQAKRILTAYPHRVHERRTFVADFETFFLYNDEYMPLHFAAQCGKLRLIRTLVSCSADINAVSEVIF
jgi:hypothetical protein